MPPRLLDANAKELWGVIGRNPANETLRRFPMTFGFAPSAEEALNRVRRQYLNDVKFRNKYVGWVFSPFLASFCFRVDATGALLMQRNEKESVLCPPS